MVIIISFGKGAKNIMQAGNESKANDGSSLTVLHDYKKYLIEIVGDIECPDQRRVFLERYLGLALCSPFENHSQDAKASRE